jgi:hypothetical protein
VTPAGTFHVGPRDPTLRAPPGRTDAAVRAGSGRVLAVHTTVPLAGPAGRRRPRPVVTVLAHPGTGAGPGRTYRTTTHPTEPTLLRVDRTRTWPRPAGTPSRSRPGGSSRYVRRPPLVGSRRYGWRVVATGERSSLGRAADRVPSDCQGRPCRGSTTIGWDRVGAGPAPPDGLQRTRRAPRDGTGARTDRPSVPPPVERRRHRGHRVRTPGRPVVPRVPPRRFRPRDAPERDGS